VVTEGEQPAVALRRKPRASIIVATGAQKIGKAVATVTMGSTGAAMVAAAVGLGVMEGLERPALGGPIVGMAPNTAIIDLGTNVDCKPAQLLSFAVIGDVFARSFWGIENPRVALLSVGSEAGKGNRQVKETTELLERSGLNFVGNIEANDLPYSRCEVAVCDGFVGNVVMKLTEGLGSAITDHVRGRLGGRLSKRELDDISRELYELHNIVETFGGGPLLGVNGVSVVGHGRGKAESVVRAIETAKKVVEIDFVPNLQRQLSKMQALVAQGA
jgi:glycerol-3-phosphate acyltransferase PlsX